MENQWMNDCLAMYIKRPIAHKIDNDDIMKRF